MRHSGVTVMYKVAKDIFQYKKGDLFSYSCKFCNRPSNKIVPSWKRPIYYVDDDKVDYGELPDYLKFDRLQYY